MWEQYRKTMVPVQLLILTVTAIFYFTGAKPSGIASVVFVMEVGAVYGARWAVRLRRASIAKEDKLPLAGR